MDGAFTGAHNPTCRHSPSTVEWKKSGKGVRLFLRCLIPASSPVNGQSILHFPLLLGFILQGTPQLAAQSWLWQPDKQLWRESRFFLSATLSMWPWVVNASWMVLSVWERWQSHLHVGLLVWGSSNKGDTMRIQFSSVVEVVWGWLIAHWTYSHVIPHLTVGLTIPCTELVHCIWLSTLYKWRKRLMGLP